MNLQNGLKPIPMEKIIKLRLNAKITLKGKDKDKQI